MCETRGLAGMVLQVDVVFQEIFFYCLLRKTIGINRATVKHAVS